MSRVFFLWLAMSLLLSGCWNQKQLETRAWMDKVRQDMSAHVEKIALPKDFVLFEYQAEGRLDPFDPMKLTSLLQKLAENSKGKKPDMKRRREPLEAYTLDMLKMVGVIQRDNVNYALIAANQTLYQIKVGQYVGQNFGKVTKISDIEISIQELAQDATGEWVERNAALQLQESKP